MIRPITPFPTGAIKQIEGKSIVLTGNDIDTDRIIPARFLKCVSFDLLGEQVFADDRKELKGEHPFDLPINQDASILVVNENFGCGSSREHAPQALMRWGIRAIIGKSFAEIFFGNCLALGIPCIKASEKIIESLQQSITSNPGDFIRINLEELSISDSSIKYNVLMDPGPLEMLKSGAWDATSQLINKRSEILEVMKNLPYLNNFKY